MNRTLKRRDFLMTTIIGLLAASALPLHANGKKQNKRALCFVHLTYMHIHPGPVPERGIGNLLEEIHALDEKDDFVINTSD